MDAHSGESQWLEVRGYCIRSLGGSLCLILVHSKLFEAVLGTRNILQQAMDYKRTKRTFAKEGWILLSS